MLPSYEESKRSGQTIYRLGKKTSIMEPTIIKEPAWEPMGDDTCFLFNLTSNLRFNARPMLHSYQRADERCIEFGDGDLVINEDFDRVTSVIKPRDTAKTKKARQQ